MFYPNIAAELAKRRMSKGQFAKELGVGRKTLYNWEQKGKIPPKKLDCMAQLFGCSVDYLTHTE